MLEDFYTNGEVQPVYLEQSLHSGKTLKNLEWHLTELKPIQIKKTYSLKKKRETKIISLRVKESQSPELKISAS